ncbi:MAG: sugar phosphate nucleotidyltransferase [Clostridia bacterium]
MRAIIMAGGSGKRLRPITCSIPKPMVPLLNKPVIDYCIELIKSHGITDISITLFYLPNKIKEHIGDGSRFGVDVSYSTEDQPLGTAGSVKLAAGERSDRLIVISGDAICDIDLTEAIRSHEASGAAVTIVLKKVTAPMEYGVVLTDETGRITRFLEKPMISEVFSDLANTGIYIIEPEVMQLIPDGQMFDFSCDLFPLLMQRGAKMNGYETNGYWCDIGDLYQYMSAQREMLSGKCHFTSAAAEIGGIYREQGARISDKAILRAPCYIGSCAEIADNVVIDEYAVIGSGCRIGRGASIRRSVLMNNVRVRDNAELRGAIVCENAHIDRGAQLFEGAVIAKGCTLGKGCTVKKNVLIWPDKELAADTQYSANVVWEDSEALSGDSMLRGHCDYDLTPERAVRIGAVIASMQHGQREFAIATDGSLQANMLKHAVISGMISQGADVYELECCSRTAFEFSIEHDGLSGGVMIKRCSHDPHMTELLVCDGLGALINAKELRCFKSEIRQGEHHPATDERLGVLQRLGGSTKAYEAHVARELGNFEGDGMCIIIADNKPMFDTVLRVLSPHGVRVQFMEGRKGEKLHGAMVQSGAELGCIVDADNDVTALIYGDRYINRYELYAVLVLDSLRNGRMESFTLPISIPNEYIAYLKRHGAKIIHCASANAQWRRAAKTGDTYLPELFEPESMIVRLTTLVKSNALASYLHELPQSCTSEVDVGCSWKDIGGILRSLVQTEREDRVELMDGIKIKDDDGWVLVQANPQATACRIMAGSYNQEYSKELCDIYRDRIKDMLKDGR